ncbi:P-loop containing nucleoside triphosphate hydrolase protein [Aureobasidium sp. EXF-12298]|nr:P-loop containing nucleoside triphosphate hydrolase protein [Aureobasidium sp. EXF-12298]
MALGVMSDGQNKSLHPFFVKPQAPTVKPTLDSEPSLPDDDASPGAEPGSSQPEPSIISDLSNGRKTRPRKAKQKPDATSIPESNESTSSTTRKRRKLSLTDHLVLPDRGSEDMLPQPSSPTSVPSSHPGNSQPIELHQDTENHPEPNSIHTGIPTTTPPKKMLKLSTGGTLISPSSKSLPAKEDAQTKKPAKRGRPKKEKQKLLVILHYPANDALGHRINRIMDGSETFKISKPASMAPPPKPKAPKFDPSKPTHPFFSGKPKDAVPTSAASVKGPVDPRISHILSPRRPSAVTPGKLRAQARENGSKNMDSSSGFPQFGANKDRNIIKQPGMVEAPFPPRGHAHVRGDFYYHTSRPLKDASADVPRSTRKMKYKIPLLDPSESSLTRVESDLDFRQKDIPRSDGFYNPPSSLRVPSRHLVPGLRAQKWISNELHAQPLTDELQSTPGNHRYYVHPACESLYLGLPSVLTPYDHGKSEVQAWAQKYSPQCASQVLQLGREATYLREWMKALTINTVETAGSQIPKHDKSSRERGPKKKRRKKAAGLDDFIVNDDDIFNDPDELMELDDPSLLRPGQTPSLVRNTDFKNQSNRSKIANSVIVSGPSGCGKTAMIHAAAKELGFEIFEINPGSRRSGKDVLDRIGNMVENHLVQNRSLDAGNTSADEDAGRLSDAFNKDLESGRQGTMKSFFTSTPKSVAQPKKEHKPKINVEQVQKVLSSSKPSRGQKQSLILLEEVDIMFEEDKNFWTTIFTILESSKRPVIMTCNDEDLVPLQAITCQALLRLSAPPADIAIDYMLLMAAQEGHLLHRDAVSTLYNAKHHDLRASIAELQLWCQKGVGDPRGGLSWIFPRWPAGSGLDEYGQPIRVFSENTYQAGMGFVAHETSSPSEGTKDDELLKETWEGWNIDPRDELFAGVTSTAPALEKLNPQSRMAALKQYSDLSDSLSDMDVFCQVGLPGKENHKTDTTQPELPPKTRASYINGMALLQTPEVVDYSTLDTQLAVSGSRLVRSVFSNLVNQPTPSLTGRVIETHSPGNRVSPLTRGDISTAFDTIATMMTTPTPGPPSLAYSVFDGPLKTVVADVAPYVRSIAAFDLALETRRGMLQGSSQGSTGGSGAGIKRARTTRAARSALEGGQRQLTRRERWFDPAFDLALALRTAGDWPRVESEIAEARLHSPGFDGFIHMGSFDA